jgi:hypothetical protein
MPNIRDVTSSAMVDPLYNNLTDAISVRTHNTSQTIDGHTLFTLARCRVNPESSQGWSLVDTAFLSLDMAGNIEYYQPGFRGLTNKLINSTTVVKAGLPGAPGNLSFWNMGINTSRIFPVPEGHHDFVYNPVDEQFMVLSYESSTEMWNGLPIGYDDIWIYDTEGNVDWHWNASVYLPFNSTMYDDQINQTFRGRTDWMHGNALVWDWDEGVVYYNVRNLNTVYKIDTETKEILWGAGEWGDFDLIDKNGNAVEDSLWFQSHGLEMTGPNRFILFDNDMFNYSNPESMTADRGYSSFVEFEVDEEEGEVREVWEWTAPDNNLYYFPRSGGDADRLPNGNTLGIFGVKGNAFPGYSYPIYITEVTPSGDIAWEIEFQNTTEYYYWIYRVQRYYDAPVVSLSIDMNQELVESPLGVSGVTLGLQTWNSFNENHESTGTVRLSDGAMVILEQEIIFTPYWQATALDLELPTLSPGSHNLTVEVENSDGRIGSSSVSVSVGTTWLITVIGIVLIVAIAAVVIVVKRRRSA